MQHKPPDRSTSKLLARCAGALLLPLLALPPASAQQVKKNGIAIWELSSAKLNALLNSVPATDAARYDRLRQSFIDFGCTGSSLQEQAIDRKGRERNLVCTLSGDSSQRILVASSFSVRSPHLSGAWPEAVMLPILYHALSAQPHHSSFVFAALSGPGGERHFFDLLHKGEAPQPILFVALDALGLGAPHFYVTAPSHPPAAAPFTGPALLDTAWHIAQLQGFTSQTVYLAALQRPNPAIFPNDLLNEMKNSPRVLVYSTFDMAGGPTAFREDHDFIAFFLGALDMKLTPPPAH